MNSVGNYAQTQLTENVYENDITLRVVDASVFPSELPFPVLCMDEIMNCTARALDQNILLVTRAQEGTTAGVYYEGYYVTSNITKKNIMDLNAAV